MGGVAQIECNSSYNLEVVHFYLFTKNVPQNWNSYFPPSKRFAYRLLQEGDVETREASEACEGSTPKGFHH